MNVVSGTALYEAVQAYSRGSKRYWIASPYLGRDSHNIFSDTFHEARDTRFVLDVKSGAVDRKELERVRKWAGNLNVRTLRRLHAKIYIFDKACIVTSANLSLVAFERNHEIGHVLTGAADMKRVRTFFTSLWKKASTVTPKQVNALPTSPKWGTTSKDGTNAVRAHTSIDKWDKDPNSEDDDALVGAGETVEIDALIAPRLRERIANELKRMNLPRSGVIVLPYGVREASTIYRKGWLFDTSYSFGTRTKTWKIGAEREIGKVISVIKVGGTTVLLYRSAVKTYRIDPIVLNAAKKLHIYRGDPDSFEIRDYLQIVKRRKALHAKPKATSER